MIHLYFLIILICCSSLSAMTQSEGHMRVLLKDWESPLHSVLLKKMVAKHRQHYGKCQEKDFLEVASKALIHEEEFSDKIVCYHGTRSSIGFVIEVMTAWDKFLHPERKDLAYYRLRPEWKDSIETSLEAVVLKHFAYLQTQERQPSNLDVRMLLRPNLWLLAQADMLPLLMQQKPYVRKTQLRFDQVSDFPERFLCVNLSLFGNFQLSSCYSISYFMQTPAQGEEIGRYLRPLHDQLNTKQSFNDWLLPYLALYEKYRARGGSLLQIFIPSDRVDELAYACENEGNFLCVDMGDGAGFMNVQSIVSKWKEDPQALEIRLQKQDAFRHRLFHHPLELENYDYNPSKSLLNLVQARLWLETKEFTHPSEIRMFKYELEEQPEFQEELDRLIELTMKSGIEAT